MKVEETVKRCLEGDVKAQRQLFDAYSSMLLGICRRYAKNQYQADDIFQEAFINIFNNLHQWSAERGAFEPWIYRITVNTALAVIRKETKHLASDVEEELSIQSHDVDLDAQLSFKDLQVLIDQLPVRQKLVFNLYAIEGYTHKDIAKQLEITEGTSKSQLAKARNNLKKLHFNANKIVREQST
ncbi:MAG: sigma-70 family RNA polymerase sigma factor [Cytophagales bacterium]|nr:sigma-70 family RNA polymerase sigma factor [Cytophagales bacterium]